MWGKRHFVYALERVSRLCYVPGSILLLLMQHLSIRWRKLNASNSLYFLNYPRLTNMGCLFTVIGVLRCTLNEFTSCSVCSGDL